MRWRIVPVGIEGPPQPDNGFLRAIEKAFRQPHGPYPGEGPWIARTETERLLHRGFRFLCTTQEDQVETHHAMPGSQITVQSQGAFAMGHGLLSALGKPKHEAKDDMRQGAVGARESALEAAASEVAKYAALSSVPPHAATLKMTMARPVKASTFAGSRSRAFWKSAAAFATVSALAPL
jgi:hypothetical protein